MKLPRLRTILLAPLVLFLVFYVFGVAVNLLDDRRVEPLSSAETGRVDEFAIFKAALSGEEIGMLYDQGRP